MIQEIRIKNFLSFKDEMRLSFDASKDDFAEDYQVVQVNENTRLLRFAIVYGYNASGKTNLLRCIDFLQDFWFRKPDDLEEKTGVSPFKLDRFSLNDPSRIEVIFYVNRTKYWYQVELDEQHVYLERLLYYKSVQPTLLFERKLENDQSVIDFNVKVSKIIKEKISVECFKNMSFFAARNQVNASIPLIDEAKDWMRNQVMPVITPASDLTSYAQRHSSKNEDLTSYIVDFLREADFNISRIQTDEIDRPIPEEVMEMLLKLEVLPQEEKDRIKNEKSFKSLQTYFEHTVENERGIEKYELDVKNEESRGTLRTFGIEAALYETFKQNAFLAIDEIETSLHPKLLEKILFEFLKSKSESQVIMTTHYDGLLDLVDDLIRKDSVWFTEKQKSGVTELYKLTDFRGINRLSSIREAYRNKRFGATMN